MIEQILIALATALYFAGGSILFGWLMILHDDMRPEVKKTICGRLRKTRPDKLKWFDTKKNKPLAGTQIIARHEYTQKEIDDWLCDYRCNYAVGQIVQFDGENYFSGCSDAGECYTGGCVIPIDDLWRTYESYAMIGVEIQKNEKQENL